MASLIDELAQRIPPDRLLTRPGALAAYETDGLTAFRAPAARGRHRRVAAGGRSRRFACATPPACRSWRAAAAPACPAAPCRSKTASSSRSTGSIASCASIPAARLAVVEPGVVNLAVTALAAPHGLYYAPDPSSQQVCTIGGNVAFNSGGAHCFRHGMTANHVLGIRAVLADGTLVSLGGESLEQSGPDLAGLFVGSEGLFGVALEITLRLVARPQVYRTVLAAYARLQAAGDAVSRVIRSGLLPGAMEIMDRLAIDAAEAAVHAELPRARGRSC